MRTKFKSFAGDGAISRRRGAGAPTEKTATLPSAARGDWVDELTDKATRIRNGTRNQIVIWPQRSRGSSHRTRLNSVRG